MVRTGPRCGGALTDARVPGIAASLGVMAGAALPFFSILGRSKSAYSLARSAQRLDVFGASVQRIGVLAVIVVPLLVGVSIVLVCGRFRGARQAGSTLTILIGLIGIACGTSGLLISAVPRFSHAVLTVSGSLAFMCGTWLLLGRARGNRGQQPVVRPVANVGFVCGAILVIAGGVFAYDSLRARAPRTPTEAARLMFDGLERQDPIQMLEALNPVERRVLVDSGQDLARQLRRLELVGSYVEKSSRKPNPYSGKRTYRESLVQSEVVNVQVVSGEIDSGFSAVGLSSSPRLAGIIEGTGLIRVAGASAVQRPILTTIEVGKTWYVSLGHTYADGARRQAGKALPISANLGRSSGQSSPEAAVRAFLDAAVRLDALGILDASDPSEVAAGYSYVNLAIVDLNRRAKGVNEQVGVTFPELSLVTSRNGGVATVRVKRWSALAVLYADDVEDSTVRLDRDCVTVSVAGVETIRCGRQVPLVLSDLYGVSAREWTPEQSRWLSEPQRLPGIVTVERNGKWFVSPLRSAIEVLLYWSNGLEPDDLVGKGNSLADRFSVLADAVSTVVG